MFYINTETLEYPVAERFIRNLFSLTVFPKPFVPLAPYAAVQDTPRPEIDHLRQYVKEVAPEQVDGIWYRRYEASDLDADVIAENLEAHALQVRNEIVQSVQARLDSFAQQRNYDGILSAATYATSTNVQFAKEGQFCVQARDNTWAALYSILAEVQAGTRPTPSGFEDIAGDLPVLDWANCV